MLCTDPKGAVIEMESKEWVHHTCVNWHNEIWFENNDMELKNYGGQLDFSRFNLLCYICKEKHGSCIECDL